MAKKLSIDIDYFEGYQMLGIVSSLKDYTLAFYINTKLDIELKKYNDIRFSDKSDNIYGFSWYYFFNNHVSAKIYLISNKSASARLIPSKKQMDYFMLFKDFSNIGFATSSIQNIRKINNVMAVFNLDLNNIKDADLFIENIELHEIEEILKPAKQASKKYIKPNI
jgi:hypothetical protein